MNMLKEFFRDRLISAGLWSPRSPSLISPIFSYNTAFTHSCLCLASPLARTFICLCLCAKELFSHAYEYSPVRTHYANRHSSPLTRVRKTASRVSAMNGEANDATNDESNI